MCEQSENTTSDPLTLSQEGSPAKTLAEPAWLRESAKEREVGFGRITPESLASYDPISSSWKTSQACLDGEWAPFLETWPESGMTQNGELYPLRQWDSIIYENEFGLWPTPTASDFKGASSGCRKIREAEISMLRYFLHFHFAGPDQKTTYPNPTLLEAMMGYPIGHTELKPSETL